jgi:flagellar biosynthesis/type III secretory pathway protein FliH
MEFAWADKLREEGHQKGRLEGLDEGLLKGKRDTLLRLMMAKFGPLSEELATRIQGLESLEELDQYLDRLVTASSLAEMQLSN